MIIKRLLGLPVLPLYAAYRIGLLEFVTGGRLLALVPGKIGVIWRGAWYRQTLSACGEGLYVDWMAAIRTPKTTIGTNVFIGTFCWIGWAHIGNDVMFGGHVTVLSGARHHDFHRIDIPMTAQQVHLSPVCIDSNVWIGNGAIIMADVAEGNVVGAGAVVNKTFEARSIIAGAPARPVGRRGSSPGSAPK